MTDFKHKNINIQIYSNALLLRSVSEVKDYVHLGRIALPSLSMMPGTYLCSRKVSI